MAGMSWTTEKPTKPGWYWHKRNGTTYILGLEFGRNQNGEDPKRMSKSTIRISCGPDHLLNQSIETRDFNKGKDLQWAGPLEPPQ
jgi:hypothetical protein